MKSGEIFGKGLQISAEPIESIEPIDTQKELAKVARTSHDTLANIETVPSTPSTYVTSLRHSVSGIGFFTYDYPPQLNH